MGDAKKYTVWGLDDGVRDAFPTKPITTPEQQIELLKNKGVTFECCAEDHAIEILTSAEAYLHLSAYRALFQRHEDGPDAGKFVSLDFGDLLDVSSPDDALREAFRLMANETRHLGGCTRVAERPRRPQMKDAVVRYGTQNPLVFHLAFLARVLDAARA